MQLAKNKKKKTPLSETSVKINDDEDKINQMKAFHGRGLSSYIGDEEIKSKEKLERAERKTFQANTYLPVTPQPLIQNDGDSSDMGSPSEMGVYDGRKLGK